MIQVLFHICFQRVRQEITGRKQDFTSPHLFVPFLFVLFTHSIDKLELPGLIRVRNRITVLFIIQSTANLKKLKTTSLTIQMVDMSNIPLAEIQLVKNVLEKHCLKSLSVWYVCNDSMIEYHWNDLSQLVFPWQFTNHPMSMMLVSDYCSAWTERSHHYYVHLSNLLR